MIQVFFVQLIVLFMILLHTFANRNPKFSSLKICTFFSRPSFACCLAFVIYISDGLTKMGLKLETLPLLLFCKSTIKLQAHWYDFMLCL